MFTTLRPRFDFWLDLRKPEEEEIAYQIVELKAKRMFVDTIRKGIRLMISLMLGRTDVLEELFPMVVERLREEGRAEAEGRGSHAQAQLQAQIDRLEGLLAEQWNRESVIPSAPEAEGNAGPALVSGNLKALAGLGTPPPGPEGDDELADLLEVKDVSSEDGGVAAQNLIKSMLAMQSVKSDKTAKIGKSVKRKRQSLDDLLEIRVVEGS